MSSTNLATEAERLATIELSRLFHVLLRFRLFASPMVALFGLLLVLYHDAWRGWLCIGAAVPVAALSLWELVSLGRRRLEPGRIVGIVSSVFVVYLALIIVTGGITSPIAIALPLLAVVMAFGAGQRRVVFVVVGAVLAAVWVLGALAFTTPPFEPSILARGPSPPWLLILLLFALTVAPCFGAGAGMVLRAALERAVASAAESRGELVESMRERNAELLSLASALAHELKNPLAAIRGLAALQAKKLEPGTKQAEQMAVLLDEVARMGTILDEFLNFSRPAAGLAVESVDVGRVVRDVCRIHEPLAAERDILICLDAAGPLPARCDPRKLKQILVNLMQNAIDASEPGSEVQARVVVEDGTCIIHVEDRGAGLADAVRGRLFTAGTTTKVAGSGLGLTIARAIAEQHGGTLTIAERDGGGCSAEVRLPSGGTPDDDGRS